jgi:hypothetical protein
LLSLLAEKRTWPFAGSRFRGRYWGKADMGCCTAHVRFLPKADIGPNQILMSVVRHFSLAARS